MGGKFRHLLLGDLPGQKHAAGLAADGTAADHAAAQTEIVVRGEVLPDQSGQPLVPGHGAADDLGLRVRVELPVGVIEQGRAEKAVIAVVVLILSPGVFLVDGLVVAAHAHAVLHGGELPGVPPVPVGEEHLVGIAVPHLQRVEIHIFLVGVHVQQQLGGVPDAGHGVKGVAAPDQGEIGHGVQLEEVGAGDPEEVAHHQIGIPHRLELGQAVKHIEGVSALAGDLMVDGHGKGLEALVRVEGAQLDAGQVGQQRLMLGKTDIDDAAAVGHRLPGKGLGKHTELIQVGDLPYHVVAQPDVVQDPVHLGIPAGDSVECSHTRRSLLIKSKRAEQWRCERRCSASDLQNIIKTGKIQGLPGGNSPAAQEGTSGAYLWRKGGAW